MSMTPLRASLLVLVGLFLTSSALAADPVAQTSALVTAFKAVKTRPKGSTEPLSEVDRRANGAAFLALDAFFDYERIAGDAIAPRKAAFSAEQLKKFMADFREVIRLVAYPDSGRALGKATSNIKAGAKRADKKLVDVDMVLRFEGEDSDTKVTFHWVDVGGSWKVYDVSFDGASLVKDYQNQFGRIIDKDKVDGLMKKLQKKLDEKRKDSVVAP
jgi:ABC-type transporter MlaC component